MIIVCKFHDPSIIGSRDTEGGEGSEEPPPVTDWPKKPSLNRVKPRFNESLSLQISSLVDCVKKINAFLVFFICFHKTVHNKWCLDKVVAQIDDSLCGFFKNWLNYVWIFGPMCLAQQVRGGEHLSRCPLASYGSDCWKSRGETFFQRDSIDLLWKLGSSNCCILHSTGMETCTKIYFLFIFNLV